MIDDTIVWSKKLFIFLSSLAIAMFLAVVLLTIYIEISASGKEQRIIDAVDEAVERVQDALDE